MAELTIFWCIIRRGEIGLVCVTTKHASDFHLTKLIKKLDTCTELEFYGTGDTAL